MSASPTPLHNSTHTDHLTAAGGPTIIDAADLGTVLGIWAHPDDEHHLLGITDGTCAAQPFDARVRHLSRVIDAVAPDTIVTSELAVELRLGPALIDRKIVALRAQASQSTELIAALGEQRVRDRWSTETFVSADAAQYNARIWGTWRVAA